MRLGGKLDGRAAKAKPFRAEPYLPDRLFAGDIDDAAAGAAIAAATWIRMVDLPMPGSPPTRMAEPGTKPPPTTRSNSPMPESVRGRSAVSPASDASGNGVRDRCGALPGRRRAPPR